MRLWIGAMTALGAANTHVDALAAQVAALQSQVSALPAQIAQLQSQVDPKASEALVAVLELAKALRMVDMVGAAAA